MSKAPSAFLSQRVVIGVGALAISQSPEVTLSTYALGSCVGVAVYDPTLRIGGMLHLMLPDSALSPGKARDQPALFADTGLPLLFQGLVDLKVNRSQLRIVVAGGANVICGHDAFRTGERNVRATLDFLARHGFAPLHQEVHGSVNRALHLDLGTGGVTLKTPHERRSFSLGF